jgi:protocatechuate 3,4-dioxygenase beta subunit
MRLKPSKDTALRLLDRRDALAALGALGLFGCAAAKASAEVDDGGGTGREGDASPTTTDASDAATATDGGECVEIPDETGGPYPDVDGMISNTKYDRSDITEGKTGTPLTLTLQVLDVAKACAPIVGARVIIWHCDANGVYSEYANSMNSDTAQNDVGSTTTTYLRGWQVTDATGTVTFKTIFPGWYTPRVTHIHVMVYNPDDLTTPVKTTQFTFPQAMIETAYDQASLYPKGQNATTVATDMVFAGSDEHLVAAVTGSSSSGYAATLPIGLTTY